MDNQNNNFENNNRVPREPDFPPKEDEKVNQTKNGQFDFKADNSAENTEYRQQENTENSYNGYNGNNTNTPTEPFPDNRNVYNGVNQQPFVQQTQEPDFKYGYGYNGAYPQNTGFNQNINPTPQSRYYSGAGSNAPSYSNGQNNSFYGNGENPNINTNYSQFYNPYGYNNQGNNYGGNPVPQAKNKNTGLKVFLICLCIVFGICLVGFVGTISYSLGQSNASSNKSGDSVIATEYPDSNQSTQSDEHQESDYSDKINSTYEGLKLENQVKDKDNAKYTSESSYNTVSGSVVGVICYKDEITDASKCTTQGSGIIISEDGYIITNAHIISNSKTKYAIQVITSDSKTYSAGVVGYDSRTDIALLKADAQGLKPASFGKSEDMQVGTSVIAIGNPGGIGYQNSITGGVISALNRTVPSSTNVKYIQTDAAINPGNSGGPLCNYYGQIIGMNTSKIVSEKYEGMGFAIPSETIKSVVDDLMKQGYVGGRVKLGIIGTAVNAAQMAQYNLPAGILVDSVDENGPLKDSGISKDDIITKIDGESVSNFGEVYAVLEKHKAGDKIKVEVYRSPYIDGEEKTFEEEVTLAEDKGE